MKKLLLAVIAVLTMTFTNAQDGGFANGDIFISGSVQFNSEKTGDLSKTTSFGFAPRVGLFVSDNIAVGARLGFTSRKQEVINTGDIKTNIFNIGAFGRYYFTPSTKFSIFGEAGFNYESSKFEVGSDESKVNGFGINVGPGVSYFLSDNFALEALWGAIEYRTSKPDADGSESTNNFDFGVNLDDISLGLVYKF